MLLELTTGGATCFVKLGEAWFPAAPSSVPGRTVALVPLLDEADETG